MKMMKKILIIIAFTTSALLFSQQKKANVKKRVQTQVEKSMPLSKSARPGAFTQRLQAGGINVRGNMTFIGNNNLSIDVGRTRTYWQNRDSDLEIHKDTGSGYQLYLGNDGPNTTYNSNIRLYDTFLDRYYVLNNGRVYMDYVDVDSDNSTFSSSTSTLNLPNCSRVIYAGLYWAGVYGKEFQDQTTPRSNDYNQIKFKLPSSANYIDITADDIIYNTNEPYICFKDVTSLIDANNPNGVYTGANIRAIRGIDEDFGLGGSSGWVMVVIYENDNDSSKNISIFDGFANISSSNEEEIKFTGFTTIQNGPVKVEQIVATLEGDGFISGDNYQIKNQANNFVNVYNTESPENNFFNGTITIFDTFLAGRTPSSENTLGFDVDHISIDNTSNSIIANSQTEVDSKFTSTGDVYWPFLNAMSVEIIEPKIKLIKTIEDAAGNAVAPNTPIALGAELFYNLSFQSVGTDNALRTEIIDILPKNVSLLESDIVLPDPSITYTYEPPVVGNGFRGKLTFNIPDSFVQIGDPAYEIKLKVRVASDCSELRDVCSNTVENQAYANYSRDLSANNDPNDSPDYDRIENTLSFSGVDACNLGQAGTSNFLLDTSGCSFERTEVMCTASLDITAGNGFTSYSWVDQNGNNVGNTQTITVNQPGTYTVTKTAPVGCIDATEIVNVVSFNNEPNPLAAYADQVLPTCNGFELAEIYLCGDGSTREIRLPFTSGSATTVIWFKRNEAVSCAAPVAGCANVDAACSWDNIGTEINKTFSDAGEYKIEVLYDGRCPKTYYFNVFKATLNPTIVKEDILCGDPGTIRIDDVPNGYEYMLSGPGIASPAFQASNTFSVTQPGDFNLSIRLAGASAAACTYTFPAINIQERTIGLNVIPTNMECADGNATIRVQVNNVPGDYIYTLTQTGASPVVFGPTSDNDHTFTVTDGGFYNVEVTTTTSSCTASQTTRIDEPDQLTLSAVTTKNISCKDGASNGIITLNATGGTIDSGDNYSFAIVSINGVAVTTKTYFTNTTHEVALGDEGVYVFEVVDSNNCTVEATATVVVEPELQFNHTPTDISCNGLNDGRIEVTLNGSDQNYTTIEYSVDGGANWNPTGVFTGLAANTYTVTIRASKPGYQCTYEITGIQISEPTPITGEVELEREFKCTAGAKVRFFNIVGGTPPYNYGVDSGSGVVYYSGQGAAVFNSLNPGTYNFYIRDSRGCQFLIPTPIVVDPAPNAPVLTPTIVYNCDGTGNVTLSTVRPNYEYSLDGEPTVNTNNFPDLSVGPHIITVFYGKDCKVDVQVNILAGNAFSGNIVASSDSECFGSDNGSITIGANNPIGGSFEYSTDGGSTWSSTADNPYRVVGLAAGIYNVFIRETDGGKTCTVDLGNVTITQPDELTLSATVSQVPSCSGPSTGTITATATGGVPPYTFSIDGGTTWQSSNIFSNVTPRAADYIVMVRDSRNCNECGCTSNLFENGSFEQPASTRTRYGFYHEDNVPGWNTTHPDNEIELWHNNYNGVPAYEGNVHAELNARRHSSTLYQEFCTQPGDVINWSLAHRGTLGTDVAVVKIGDDLATARIERTITADNTAWVLNNGTYTVPAGQSTTIIAFEAVSTSSGSIDVGNLIDDVKITIARNNCVPVSVPVNDPTPVDFTVTPVTCYNGTANNGTLTVDVTAGNGNYQFSIDGGAWQSPNAATPNQYIFSGLTNGTYSIRVQDGLGCTIPPKTGTINPQIGATITPTNETCNTGQIAITPTGGDGNYQYVVTPVAPTGGATITTTTSPINVSAGTYTVSVRDQGGATGYCEYSENVTITRIVDPTSSATVVQPDCTGGTGTINVTVANGTAPYTVTVTGSGAPVSQGPSTDLNYSFTGLASDTYQITVTDANNCSPVAITRTITAPSPLSGGSATATDFQCSSSGTVQGTITFTAPTGGTPGVSPVPDYIYFYRVSGAPAPNPFIQISGTSISNIAAGTYNTRVEDANGCGRDLNDVTIAPLPTAPTLTSSIVYNCDGTGNITVTPTPAAPVSGSYTYSLDGVGSQASNVFNNVPVGAHTVSVGYGSNCTEDVDANVLTDNAFGGSITATANNVCFNESNGSITITATNIPGGGSTFEYNTGSGWLSATSNPFTVTGLAAATYTVQIRPNNSSPAACTQTIGSTTINNTPQVVAGGTVTKEITCTPNTGATITPTGSGGNGAAFTYELFNSSNVSQGTTTTTFTNIAAGTYTIVATDRLSCTSAPFTIVVNPRIDVAFTATPQCYDGTDGRIVVNVTGGNGNYTFSLDGGTTPQTPASATPNTYTFTGVSNGNYNVTVQDGRGCTRTEAVTINPQLLATADVTNASCNPGSIQVNPTGGSGSNYIFSVVTANAAAPADGTYNSTNPIIRPAGTYDVYVRDNNGTNPYCQYLIEDVVIASITPVALQNIVVNEPTCNGDTGSIEAQITPNTGQAPHTITIANSTGIITSRTITGFTGANFSFNNLPADSYVLTITDALNCSFTHNFTLTNPPALVIDLDPVLPANCAVDPANTGFNFISVNPTDYLPNTLQYSIDNGATWVDFTTTNGQVRNLNSGDVVFPALQTIDGSGNTLCLISYGRYEIPYNVTGLIVNPIVIPGNCSVGLTVTVEALDGTAPFQFAINSPSGWVNADALDNGTLGDPARTYTFTNLIPGVSYDFYVRDGTGCIKKNNENIYADFTPTVPITTTVNNQACFGANSGQLTFSINNTSGDLSNTFTWTLYERDPATNVGTAIPAYTNVSQTGFADIVVNGLAPGIYYVILTNDTATCNFGSQDQLINQGTAINGSLNELNGITCNNPGRIRIENVVGGFPPYTYTVTANNGGTATVTGNEISVTAPTTSTTVDVTVNITDSNGCTIAAPLTETLNVAQQPTITAVADSCPTAKTITITTTGGATPTPPYQYSTDGGTTYSAPTTNTTFTANNVAPGSYNVFVRDANGCTNNTTVIVYNNIQFTVAPTQNAVCTANGQATLNITSGSHLTGGVTANYSYTIDGVLPATALGVGNTSATISLAPGTYNIAVIDNNAPPACTTSTKPVTIQDPIQPSFTYTQENSLCNGSNSGSITVTAVNNGILPLTYRLTNSSAVTTVLPAGDGTFTGLAPDTYSITAVAATAPNGNNCSTTINNITITEFNAFNFPSPSTNVTQFACTAGSNTVNNATVTLLGGITGGSGTYTRYVFTYTPADGSGAITQDGSGTSFVTSNTSGGPVTITVYDDKGCTGVTNTTINAFTAIGNPSIAVDNAITCNTGEDITVTYTPNTVNTNITIEGTNTTTYGPITQNGVTSGDFDGLATGDYKITIFNPATNCSIETFHTVGDAPQFDLLVSNVIDETCKASNDGSVTLSFSTTTPYGGNYTYVIHDASDDSVVRNVTTSQSGSITVTGLSGTTTYYIIATLTSTAPPAACTTRTANFTINEPVNPLSVTGVENPAVSCNNGSNATITATPAGGWGDYVYQLESPVGTVVPSYTFAANGNNNVFTNLAAGTYTIRVRDKNGVAGVYCEATNQVVIANPAPLTFTAVDTDNSCDPSVGGTIAVNVTSGVGPYTYTLSNGTGIIQTQVTAANNYTFSNLVADTYSVNVVTANGCTSAAGPVTGLVINPNLAFTLTETKKVACSATLPATPDGTVSVQLSSWVSGTSNYTYTVSGSVDGALPGGNVTSNPFTITIPASNTTPQDYTVTVTDTATSPTPCNVVRTIRVEPATLPSFTADAVVDNICFGSSTGAIKVTPVDNGILPLTYTIMPNVGTFDTTTNTFEGLPADTYTITARGTNGCTTTVSETVTTNPDIDISGAITVNQFGCTTDNTTNNATITVNTAGVGGTGNFVRAVFVYDNGTPTDPSDDLTQDSGVFNYTVTDEAGGEVSITVYDSNNCSDTETRTINPFARITGVTVTPQSVINCRDGENIIAVVNSTRPIPNFEYRLYNNATNVLMEPARTTDGDFVTLLPTGVYRIEFENTDTNCVFTEYHTVNDAPSFELIVDNIQRACFGGTASANLSFNAATPYTGNYTYEVFQVGGTATGITGNGNGNSAITINGLAAGNYYITINMGANSPHCTAQSNNFEIVQPTADLTIASELTYIKCTPTDTGEVKLTATGGWGVYNYELVRINGGTRTTVQSFDTNSAITGLVAGNYEATVRDVNNCTETLTFQLDAGTPVTGTFTVTPNNCIGDSTASITVVASGGQIQDPALTYSYILEYPNGTRTTSQSSNTFNNLPAGNGYHVLIADGYSCDARVGPINIVDPTKATATANIISDITCSTPEAVVEVIGSGGAGPYMFSLDGINFVAPNAAPNHRFNVGAGDHRFYVRDSRMCVSDPTTKTINPYTDLTATLNTESGIITCNGNSNAVLSATAQHGFGNYEYQLLSHPSNAVVRSWQSSNTFQNLDVGNYKIIVRSTNRFGVVCDVTTAPHEVTQPLPLRGTAVATQNVTCFGGSTGIITAQGFDGNGNYEYNLLPVIPNPLYPADKFVTNGVFENLPAGFYDVTIKDVKGCTILPPIRVEITQPDELQISLVSVTQQTCKNSATPTITVNVQGGTQPYYISINNVELATPYTTNTITLGAAEGIAGNTTYVISVRDNGAGCESKAIPALTTDEPVDLQLTVDFEYTCPVGNIIKAIVADRYKNNMSYSLYLGSTRITTNNTGEFIDVPAGNGYYVTATHTVTSCIENSSTSLINIEDYQPLTMTVDDSQKNLLIIKPDGGKPPYTYSIDGSDFEDANNADGTYSYQILQTKDYKIIVKDARGCEIPLTVRGVYVTITVPNLFTPDGDGTNDYWYPLEVEDYHDLRVFIYDRYARKIQTFQGVHQGWDGLYDGKPLPSGDYWYTIYYKELSGEEKKLMGHFTLYR